MCQVSRISQCSAGMIQLRIIGPGPSEASMGEPPSIMTQVPTIHSALWHPLANGHTPVTFHPCRPESGHELRRQAPTMLNVGSEPRDHRGERGLREST